MDPPHRIPVRQRNVLDKRINLRFWVMKVLGNEFKVCVEGYTPIENEGGEFQLKKWHTTAIAERLTAKLLRTASGSTYHLEGSIDRDTATQIGYSNRLINEFASGFPTTWDTLLYDWFCQNANPSTSIMCHYNDDVSHIRAEESRLSRSRARNSMMAANRSSLALGEAVDRYAASKNLANRTFNGRKSILQQSRLSRMMPALDETDQQRAEEKEVGETVTSMAIETVPQASISQDDKVVDVQSVLDEENKAAGTPTLRSNSRRRSSHAITSPAVNSKASEENKSVIGNLSGEPPEEQTSVVVENSSTPVVMHSRKSPRLAAPKLLDSTHVTPTTLFDTPTPKRRAVLLDMNLEKTAVEPTPDRTNNTRRSSMRLSKGLDDSKVDVTPLSTRSRRSLGNTPSQVEAGVQQNDMSIQSSIIAKSPPLKPNNYAEDVPIRRKTPVLQKTESLTMPIQQQTQVNNYAEDMPISRKTPVPQTEKSPAPQVNNYAEDVPIARKTPVLQAQKSPAGHKPSPKEVQPEVKESTPSKATPVADENSPKPSTPSFGRAKPKFERTPVNGSVGKTKQSGAAEGRERLHILSATKNKKHRITRTPAGISPAIYRRVLRSTPMHQRIAPPKIQSTPKEVLTTSTDANSSMARHLTVTPAQAATANNDDSPVFDKVGLTPREAAFLQSKALLGQIDAYRRPLRETPKTQKRRRSMRLSLANIVPEPEASPERETQPTDETDHETVHDDTLVAQADENDDQCIDDSTRNQIESIDNQVESANVDKTADLIESPVVAVMADRTAEFIQSAEATERTDVLCTETSSSLKPAATSPFVAASPSRITRSTPKMDTPIAGNDSLVTTGKELEKVETPVTNMTLLKQIVPTQSDAYDSAGSSGDSCVDSPVPEAKHTLNNWYIQLLSDRFAVIIEGYRLDAPTQVWHTTPIVGRVNSHLLMTSTDSLYRIHGSIDADAAFAIGFPDEIIIQFKHGFPVNWRDILLAFYNKRRASERRATVTSPRILPAPKAVETAIQTETPPTVSKPVPSTPIVKSAGAVPVKSPVKPPAAKRVALVDYDDSPAPAPASARKPPLRQQSVLAASSKPANQSSTGLAMAMLADYGDTPVQPNRIHSRIQRTSPPTRAKQLYQQSGKYEQQQQHQSKQQQQQRPKSAASGNGRRLHQEAQTKDESGSIRLDNDQVAEMRISSKRAADLLSRDSFKMPSGPAPRRRSSMMGNVSRRSFDDSANFTADQSSMEEALNEAGLDERFKATRSGRISKPVLAGYAGQRIRYNIHGEPIGVSDPITSSSFNRSNLSVEPLSQVLSCNVERVPKQSEREVHFPSNKKKRRSLKRRYAESLVDYADSDDDMYDYAADLYDRDEDSLSFDGEDDGSRRAREASIEQSMAHFYEDDSEDSDEQPRYSSTHFRRKAKAIQTPKRGKYAHKTVNRTDKSTTSARSSNNKSKQDKRRSNKKAHKSAHTKSRIPTPVVEEPESEEEPDAEDTESVNSAPSETSETQPSTSQNASKRWTMDETKRLQIALKAARPRTDEDWHKVSITVGNGRTGEMCKKRACGVLGYDMVMMHDQEVEERRQIMEQTFGEQSTFNNITARMGTLAHSMQMSQIIERRVLMQHNETHFDQDDDPFGDPTANTTALNMMQMPSLADISADDSVISAMFTPKVGASKHRERTVPNPITPASTINDTPNATMPHTQAVSDETMQLFDQLPTLTREQKVRYLHQLQLGRATDLTAAQRRKLLASTEVDTPTNKRGGKKRVVAGGNAIVNSHAGRRLMRELNYGRREAEKQRIEEECNDSDEENADVYFEEDTLQSTM